MLKIIAITLALTFAGTALVMCDQDDGPAEQIGHDIDEAVDDVTGN